MPKPCNARHGNQIHNDKDGLLTGTSSLWSLPERVKGVFERGRRWFGRPFLLLNFFQ